MSSSSHFMSRLTIAAAAGNLGASYKARLLWRPMQMCRKRSTFGAVLTARALIGAGRGAPSSARERLMKSLKLTHADMKPASAYNTIQAQQAANSKSRVMIRAPRRSHLAGPTPTSALRRAGGNAGAGGSGLSGRLEGAGRSTGQVSGRIVGWGGGPLQRSPAGSSGKQSPGADGSRAGGGAPARSSLGGGGKPTALGGGASLNSGGKSQPQAAGKPKLRMIFPCDDL